MSDQQSHYLGASTVPPPKPSRPFTEYNIFFHLEREYILQAAGQGNVANPPAQADEDAASRPEKYRNLVLPVDWYVVGKYRNKKRKHRKSHGTITFVELTKTISKAWGTVDAVTKKYCRAQADKELKRYRKDIAEYVAKYGEVAKKGKKCIESETTTAAQESKVDDDSLELKMQAQRFERMRTQLMEREMEVDRKQMQIRRSMMMQRMGDMMNPIVPLTPLSSSCLPETQTSMSMGDEVDRMMQRAAVMERMNNRIESRLNSDCADHDYSPSMKRRRIVTPQGSLNEFQFEHRSHELVSPPFQRRTSCMQGPTSMSNGSLESKVESFMSNFEAAMAGRNQVDQNAQHIACGDTNNWSFDDIQPPVHGENVADAFWDENDDVDVDNIWNALAEGGEGDEKCGTAPIAAEVDDEQIFEGYSSMNHSEMICGDSDITREYLEKMHPTCLKSATTVTSS